MASDFLDNLRDVCRPDGKAGRLSALFGAIDEHSDILRRASDGPRLEFARLAIRAVHAIVKAKQAYDEAS